MIRAPHSKLTVVGTSKDTPTRSLVQRTRCWRTKKVTQQNLQLVRLRDITLDKYTQIHRSFCLGKKAV